MVRRRRSLRVLGWLTLPAFLLAVGCDIAGSGSDATPTPLSALANVEISRLPTPVLTPTATGQVNRADCASIRGTDFRSEAERVWFGANCTPAPASTIAVATSAPLAATAAPIAQGCTASVTVTSDFPRKYYNVTGTTLDAIQTSLYANAPPAPGGVAAGLTEYRLAISTGSCSGPNVCRLGTTVLGAIGSVTLPRHVNEASMPPDVRESYRIFAEGVTQHEERHVTITIEGLEEAKRKLLTLPSYTNCQDLDRAVDSTWRESVQAMDLRQDAFHIADRYGAGASVVP